MVREALSLDALRALGAGEAAAYLIALRAEGFTPGERQLLAMWLAQDVANQRAYDSAERAWNSFSNAEGDEILNAMRAHALAPRQKAWTRWLPAAAAAALVLFGIGAALLFGPAWRPAILQSTRGSSPADIVVQYASARGEVKEVSLPDGSTMTLDANSIALGHFNFKTRSVRLQQGRALFAVKPDPARAFTVEAGDRSVVAVGTHFEVNLLPDGLSVTLLEGHVKISSADAGAPAAMLEPTQQFIERNGITTIRPLGAAVENEIAWRQGLINFDDQPLAEAAAMMNRYSSEQIVIGDSRVASIRVSGQFRAGDTQRFATTLKEMHKLQMNRHADQIELTAEK